MEGITDFRIVTVDIVPGGTQWQAGFYANLEFENQAPLLGGIRIVADAVSNHGRPVPLVEAVRVPKFLVAPYLHGIAIASAGISNGGFEKRCPDPSATTFRVDIKAL